jgi:hypothetical protein
MAQNIHGVAIVVDADFGTDLVELARMFHTGGEFAADRGQSTMTVILKAAKR